jgi:hypothetical protein
MLKQALSPLSNSLPQERGLYFLSPRETTARMQELEQRMEQLPRAGERVKKSR